MRPEFFILHKDLPREGPGEPRDITWLGQQITLPEGAQIADLGCGPGADLAGLLALAPGASVLALDATAQFIDAVRAQYADDARVTAMVGDMAQLDGQFDLIWCAGAAYFLGLGPALDTWRPHLKPGGAICLTYPGLKSETPSREARDFWDDFPTPTEAEIKATITDAGYQMVASRWLADSAWEAYFGPIDARIEALTRGASMALADILSEARREAAAWRAVKDETGYLQCLMIPR